MWNAPPSIERAIAAGTDALRRVGRPPTGEWKLVKSWARAVVHTVPTAAGLLWIKHGYRLPPGEEVVVDELQARYPGSLPTIVATWSGGFAMEPLPGVELAEEDSLEEWIEAARSIAVISRGEQGYTEEWLERGVRDRSASRWRGAVEALLESPVLESLDDSVRQTLEELSPEFITRYEDAFETLPTLVHQDSGCCNVHRGPDGMVWFDWADVVVGHPIFSCDRLLDQTPRAFHEEVVAAFCESSGIPLAEFRAMRRSNVLHEILRYHDELEWIVPDDPAAISLGNSVRSQIRVLVEHETRGR